MALIGRNTITGNFIKCSSLTPDGSTTTFTLTNATTGDNVYPGSQNSLLVSVSGVIQAPGDAFTINNNTITFTEAPGSSDTIDFVIILGDLVAIGTPSDDTVDTVHIKDSAVHNTKLQNSSITINGSSVSLGGSTTISTIDRPTITTSSAVIAPDTNTTFSLAGTNFVSVPIVELISSTGAITRASAVTFNNSTSLTVTTNLSAGNYFVRVENNDGGAVRSSSAILAVSAAPTWSTAAGSLGTIASGATASFTLLAYDDDSTAVSTYTLVSGSLPGGFTLDGDSSVGSISGTESGATSTTTYSFTIRATDAQSQTTDRAFSITVTTGASGGGQFN